MKPKKWNRVKVWIAMILIVAAVAGTAMEKASRTGLLASIGLVILIALITYIVNKVRKPRPSTST